MLRSQYGVAATSSSATSVSHAEDAQPNETIYKRRHGLPPQIGSTWKNTYRGPEIQRGGHGGSWTQYAVRGNSSWRGRGNFQSNRGGNQRHRGHVERSTHHASVPPIATLPDIQYHIPQTSSSSNAPSHPSMPDPPATRENQLLQPSAAPTFAEHQPVDDRNWLYRSRSPSPKIPPSTFKRRKLEPQPSNLGRNKDSMISQPIKHHTVNAEPISPKANRPLLPGRHRRPEGLASTHSLEPLAQVQSLEAVSPRKPNMPVEPPPVKQEPRTPSPARSLRTERSLITTSCKFYPIPELCKKSHPYFKEDRKAFCTEKMQELSRLRLKGIKSFFRDDGLVIEWTSQVPVWSDTLLPDFPDLASAIKRAYQMNYTPAKSSPQRKRHERESSHDNKAFKRPRQSSINDWADEIEIIEPPTTHIPLLDTSELICLDPEVIPDDAVFKDTKPLINVTSAVQQHKTSSMDVDTLTPTLTQLPKPVRRMLFKPVHPLRRNQPTTPPVQDSTLLTSDFARPLSTSVSAAEAYSKKTEIQVDPQLQDDVPQHEKTALPRPHPRPHPKLPPHGSVQSHPTSRPFPTGTQGTSTQTPSKRHTPPPPPHLWDSQTAEQVQVERVSWKDEDYGNATDPDVDLVVNLLLRGTPEEPKDRLSNPAQEEVMEDLQLHPGHEEDVDDKDDEPIAVDEDTAAVESLATQFLQRYLQLFDVDRLKLEAAYVKNALFSCRIHHLQEPSFSTAGLFAPGSSTQGFNVSRTRASISAIQKGRGQIVSRLLELGPHSFCPRGVPRAVNYDVVPLSPTIGGGILLTVHGEVVNPHLAGPQMDHVLSVDQSFVLRDRELEDQDERIDVFGQTISSAAATNLWPLVAVSHQMTVRDVALLPSEQLGLASQIQDS